MIGSHRPMSRYARRAFERRYARKSRLSLAWLHAHGFKAVPCDGHGIDCDYDRCHGWMMETREIREWNQANPLDQVDRQGYPKGPS